MMKIILTLYFLHPFTECRIQHLIILGDSWNYSSSSISIHLSRDLLLLSSFMCTLVMSFLVMDRGRLPENWGLFNCFGNAEFFKAN